MTQSVIKLTVTAEDRRVAWLATAAVGLSLVDAAIPSPLPGVKPGLANIVTLVVLARYGWGTAVWVSALRVLAGSLLLGYFLAPGFFLSLTGTTLSLLTLGAAQHLRQPLQHHHARIGIAHGGGFGDFQGQAVGRQPMTLERRDHAVNQP